MRSFLTQILASRWACVALIVAICLLAYAPGLRTIPPVDRDESRFAQASRQMAESGTLEGWMVPRIQERLRLDKPPLIYWLQSSAVLAFTGGDPGRDAIWMYRFPSSVMACLSSLIIFWMGSRMFGRRVGLLAAVTFAVCPVVVIEAHSSRADHLLTLCTVAAMAALWTVWHGRQAETKPLFASMLLWAFLGLGLLAKGPVTPIVVGLACLALCASSGQWRWLTRTRPIVGVLVLAAVVAPWLVMLDRSVGIGNYLAFAANEVRKHSAPSAGRHFGLPGFHLVLLVAVFWPGSMLSGIGIVGAFSKAFPRREGDQWPRGRWSRLKARWRAGRNAPDALLFCLCWLIPGWIVFELMATKLPHYILPVYPALALLSAWGVVRGLRNFGPGAARHILAGYRLWFVVGLLAVLSPLGIVIAGWYTGGRGVGVWECLASAASIAAAVSTVMALRSAVADKPMRAQAFGIAAMMIGCAALLGVVLPGWSNAWLSPRLLAIVARADPAGIRPLGSVEYHEDSMIFLTRGRFRRLGESEVIAWREANPSGVLVVPTPLVGQIPGASVVGRLEGFNYANGKKVDVTVLDLTAGDPEFKQNP